MIELHETTASTNDLALEAARADAPHGSCWVADTQTAGRGRREIGGERREWFSPSESNIYMSVLLRPDLQPPEASQLTLAAGVGTADALVEETDLDIWLKWPNDLYIGTRKIGGILTEAHTSSSGLEAVVVGLGINVNVSQPQVPTELRDVMTSLAIEADRRWDRLPLIFATRNRLVARCETFAESGLDAVIDAVQSYDRTADRDVEIRRGDEWVRGIARGVTRNGHLRVEVDGEPLELQAGEARFPEL